MSDNTTENTMNSMGDTTGNRDSEPGDAAARSQEQLVQEPVPVKVYETDERLTIAAPMPGLEPDDIEVEVTPDDHLILHGRVRGFLKGIKTLVVDEWTVGGYHRELKLTSPVDAALANVTYGNGVLVVVLPKAGETRPARLRLQEIAPDTGQRVGSAGHPPHPVTTEEHARAIEREEEQHGGPIGHPIFGFDELEPQG